jgi:hypothetical protein
MHPRSVPSFAALVAALVVSVVMPTAAHAQIRAGVSFSTLTGVDGFESRMGISAGVALSLLSLGPVSLTPELLYVQKGGKLSSPTAESGIEDIRLDYFVFPALIEFGNYIRGTPIRPRVYAGPYYAFQTNCSLGFESSGDRSGGCPFIGLQEAGIDADIDDSDWGFVVGGALAYFAGSIGSISIDARYTASLSTIARTGSDAEPKNRSIEFTAGWRPGFQD